MAKKKAFRINRFTWEDGDLTAMGQGKSEKANLESNKLVKLTLKANLKKRAYKAVENAILRGDLPPIQSRKCADCKTAQAEHYHHYKGYGKKYWLTVKPLCATCHRRLRARKADLTARAVHIARNNRPVPLTYKAGSHTGAMIALFMPIEYAQLYALHHHENGLPPGELHITLAYLGKADDLLSDQKTALYNLMDLISENHPPLRGFINGAGRFCNGDEEGDPFFVIPDLPQLPNLRELIVLYLKGNDIEVSQDHGFVPHITLGYFPHDDPNPFDQVERQEVAFPTISLVLGEYRYDYSFSGSMETKAALVTRVGARHTGKEYGLIQKMHDLALNLGAACHYGKAEKAGAKHSQSDIKMIQRIHDDCVELGAACPVDKMRPPLPIPVVADLMHKAQSDAPDYRPASGPNRCENCVFFKDDPGGDFCERFDFVADKDYVCDDWQPQRPDEIPGYRVGRSLAQTMKGVMALRGD